MYRNGIQHYRRARVDTADPRRIVILCYDEMISQLRIARQRFEDRDFEGKGKALIKVQDILCELQNALDFERGGDIAKNLDALYNYIRRRIVQADQGKDLRALDEVLGMLSELKSAWEQAFHSLERKAAPPRPVSMDKGKEALGAMAV